MCRYGSSKAPTLAYAEKVVSVSLLNLVTNFTELNCPLGNERGHRIFTHRGYVFVFSQKIGENSRGLSIDAIEGDIEKSFQTSTFQLIRVVEAQNSFIG